MTSLFATARSTAMRASLFGLAAAAAVSAPAYAATAPEIKLSGPLYAAFLQVQPYVAIILFAYGIYAIFHYAYHVARLRMRQVSNASGEEQLSSMPSLTGFVTHIIFVAGMIGLLMVVLFAGLDVFNALLKFVWSTASGSVI